MDGGSLLPITSGTAQVLWFQSALVHVLVSDGDGSNGISVLDFHAPPGSQIPLHIHHTHDEIFHVLVGEVTWRIGERQHVCGQDVTLLAPKGVPHTYRVSSPVPARWLAITSGKDFEGFVRAGSREAERDELPPASGPPSPEAMQQLMSAAKSHGIEILGPP